MMRSVPAFLLAIFLPCAVQAAPVSVTLYPSSALVEEEADILPEQGRLSLLLPAGADESSLTISLSTGNIRSMATRMREGQPSPAVGPVLQELSVLKREGALIEAKKASLEEQALLWSRPPLLLSSKNSTSLEAQAKDSARHLENIAHEKASLDADLQALAGKRQILENRLASLGKHNESMKECTMELDGPSSGPVRIRFSYFLKDSGWQPRYRIQAFPSEGLVKIAMDAVIHQSSGSHWNNTEVHLASSEDFRRTSPPHLPDWVLGEERPRPLLRAAAMNMGESVMEKQGDLFVHADQHDSGMVWNLGRIQADAGGQTILPVDSFRMKASFFRLIRPTEDSRAWLMAALNKDDLPFLPEGDAVFLADGMVNARGVFRLSPGETEISFGIDQLVRAKFRQISAETVPSGSKAQAWHWKADIVNSHTKAVEVRVEAPSPILRKSGMASQQKGTPSPVLDDSHSRYVWNLHVPPQESMVIDHSVTVAFPEESEKKQGV